MGQSKEFNIVLFLFTNEDKMLISSLMYTVQSGIGNKIKIKTIRY